ncbi:hypothetical protein C8R46DRAFT_1081578 [Mycena filopes]|nr:hypothetical protein C8R46DRAFT_1081578 [Mycena filopes]
MLGTVKVKSIEDLKPEAVAARGRSLPFASSRRSSDGSSRSYSGDQEHNKAYHPSDVVNAYLLDACPNAVVAVTHDDEWGAIIADGAGIPTDDELLEHIFKRYTIESGAGGVCLQHLDAAGVDEPASPTELPKAIGPPQLPAAPAYDDFEDRAPDAKPDGENLEALGASVLCLVTTDLVMAMYPRLEVTPSARLRQLLLEDATLDKM